MLLGDMLFGENVIEYGANNGNGLYRSIGFSFGVGSNEVTGYVDDTQTLVTPTGVNTIKLQVNDPTKGQANYIIVGSSPQGDRKTGVVEFTNFESGYVVDTVEAVNGNVYVYTAHKDGLANIAPFKLSQLGGTVPTLSEISYSRFLKGGYPKPKNVIYNTKKISLDDFFLGTINGVVTPPATSGTTFVRYTQNKTDVPDISKIGDGKDLFDLMGELDYKVEPVEGAFTADVNAYGVPNTSVGAGPTQAPGGLGILGASDAFGGYETQFNMMRDDVNIANSVQEMWWTPFVLEKDTVPPRPLKWGGKSYLWSTDGFIYDKSITILNWSGSTSDLLSDYYIQFGGQTLTFSPSDFTSTGGSLNATMKVPATSSDPGKIIVTTDSNMTIGEFSVPTLNLTPVARQYVNAVQSSIYSNIASNAFGMFTYALSEIATDGLGVFENGFIGAMVKSVRNIFFGGSVANLVDSQHQMASGGGANGTTLAKIERDMYLTNVSPTNDSWANVVNNAGSFGINQYFITEHGPMVTDFISAVVNYGYISGSSLYDSPRYKQFNNMISAGITSAPYGRLKF